MVSKEYSPGRGYFLSFIGMTTIGIGSAIGGYMDHEINVSPTLAKAEDSIKSELSTASLDDLNKARKIRDEYGTAVRAASPYYGKPYGSFNPEEVARLSFQPEVLEAKRILDQNQKYEETLSKANRESGMAARNSIDLWAQTGGSGATVMGLLGLWTLFLGKVFRRKALLNNSSTQTQSTAS